LVKFALSPEGYLSFKWFKVNGYTQDHKIWLSKATRIPLSYGADTLTDDYFVLPQCTRLTDRQTDRQKGHSKSSL